jgi:SdrD B-like domain
VRSLTRSCLAAALAVAACAPALGDNIGDLVWEDVNRNGLQDAGEPGIASVLVRVTSAIGYGSASSRFCGGSTSTDAGGHYSVALSFLTTNCHLTFTAPTLAHARYEPT